MTRKIEELQRKWEFLKARLASLGRKIKSDSCLESNTAVYNQSVCKIWEEMEELCGEIVQKSTDPTELENFTEEFNEQEAFTLDLKTKLQLPPKELEASYNCSNATASEVRLPSLDLPSFRGEATEWTTFADLFTAAVHNNAILTNAQKLQYLKSALKGDAAKPLKHLPITEANYSEAWSLLQQRYDNKRLIANTLARRIIGLQETKRQSLRELLDNFYEADRALKSVVSEDEKWELLVSNILTNCLDPETLQAWELSLSTTNIPPLKRLLDFLEVRARALQTTVVKTLETKDSKPRKIKCPECREEHAIRSCPKFEKSSVEERRKMVERHHLCFNCLSSQHTAVDCKASKCRKCQRNHHTTLHRDSFGTEKTNLATWSCNQEALLPTALVFVEHRDKKQKVHALLDSGSQVNIISHRMIRSLGLKTTKSGTVAQTVSGSCSLPTQVQVTIGKGNWKAKIKCYAAEKLRVTLPSCEIHLENTDYLRDLELADPNFLTPKPIDLILGMDVCSQIIQEGLIKMSSNQPVAQRTLLGWTVSGRTPQKTSTPTSLFCQTDQELRKFWELEDLPQQRILTPEEEAAEASFAKFTIRHKDGKYEVKYPFKKEPPPLGASREQAVTRFLRLEKQLDRKNTRHEYGQVIQEYLTLGHMVPVSKNETKTAYYLPHHAVYKNSSTTRLRVVFDASAKTTNGISLNDVMMNGPKIQEDLFRIILRFRIHAVAISADIEKMYRQIKISPDHQKYQRIIWRNSPHERLQEFQLTTVTFGMKASPFLATKILQKLALDEKNSYPLAGPVLLQDFYVDDLLTGTNSTDSAVQLCQELDNLLKAGGFNLRKWCSNNPTVFEGFGEKVKEENVSIGEDDTVKTLGVQWKPSKDVFTFKVQMPPRKLHTKRSLLSDTARIFDPLGWLVPLTINSKILFQDLWRLPITWDEELPREVLQKWTKYRDELFTVQNLEIPRYLPFKDTENLTLCGFCDASEKAYGAVIYLRSNSNGKIKTQLLVAKSKVAPLKPITIPRLELCSALLLGRLMKETCTALKLEIPAFYWSDSAVVLHWIREHPSKWKTFVAHRVAEIQEITEPSHWSHVSTHDNPADLISRGISAANLQTATLWWNGPHWLVEPNFKKSDVKLTTAIPEKKRIKPKLLTTVTQEKHFCHRFSNLDKLLRITAYILRFINKARKQVTSSGPVQVSEMKEAFLRTIRVIQNESFNKEIAALKSRKQISNKSQILSLTPFIDNLGILRVGGRLLHANVTFSQKHQILLPYNHHFTNLILDDIHRKNLHAGSQLMLSTLRQKYWLPKAKQAIRRLVHSCVTCLRHKAKLSEQLMGQLPQQRVTPNRPFLQTGVDYCGPINCKEMVGRSRKSHKAYVAVFICMATKAIHLEPVPSLSMESFLAVFARFISRRGVPSDIYSDNGRNFVAANQHIKELYQMLQDKDNQVTISNKLAVKGIQWHFIPPYSPHFGGLWEAGVKSLKFHLRRIMSHDTLTYEELSTVLCKVEACLNSRPLCLISMERDDLEVLTPGHFLIGEPLNTVPDGAVRPPVTLQSRYKLLQKLTNDLWRRWQSEYLSALQAKSKWKHKYQPITEGDLVILRDPNLPPQHWKLGRVVSTSRDAAGQTRVVKLQTSRGTTSRAINQVVKLFPEDEH